jgi:hypothetical protein
MLQHTNCLFNLKEDLFCSVRRQLNWAVPKDLESHTIETGPEKERKEKKRKDKEEGKLTLACLLVHETGSAGGSEFLTI